MNDEESSRPSSSQLQQQQQHHSGAAVKTTSDQGVGLGDGGYSGTTTGVVLITPTAIVCANGGDSRAIFAQRIPPTAAAASTSSTDTTTTTNNKNTNMNTNTNTNTNTTTTNPQTSMNQDGNTATFIVWSQTRWWNQNEQ